MIALVPDGTNGLMCNFSISAAPLHRLRLACEEFYSVLISHYQREERETLYAVLLLPRNPTREPTLFNPREPETQLCMRIPLLGGAIHVPTSCIFFLSSALNVQTT